MPTPHLALGDVPPHGGQADIHGQGFHTLGQGQKLPCAPDEGLLHRLRQRSHASGKPYAAKKATAATAQGWAEGQEKARIGDALKTKTLLRGLARKGVLTAGGKD